MRILVVEDEVDLAEALVEGLRKEGYAVDLALDGRSADEMACLNPYDLVVLDWTIPPPSGIELLQQWRKADMGFPVLMLTGRTETQDKVGGLDSGADDYLTKPFCFAELLARTRSLLRRQAIPVRSELRAGDVSLDRDAHGASIGDRPLSLTPKEFGILEYLMLHPERVVPRAELVEHVWDHAFDAMSNVVDVTIYRLRKKVDGGRDKKLIRTQRGVGYRIGKQRT